ncbi:MAG: tetratricopeptide repeat protein [Bacteroidetes bacterium]|nr:tetratricopeptide repeat protein [Bacteroidota bacterium]
MPAQPASDSLLNVVKHADGVAKYNALKALSKLYRPTDPEKSLKFAEQLKMLAVSMHNRSLQAEAMVQMIFPMITMQQNRKAILLLQECIRIYDSLGDLAGKAMATNNLGAAWSQYGSMDNAMSCYLEVLSYYKSKGDSNNLARVYMNLGLVYDRLMKHELAYDAAIKARDIFVLKKDKQMVANVSVNIGLSLTSLRRYKESLDYLTRALDFYEADSNRFGIAVATTNIAKMYKSAGDFRNAGTWYTRSLPYIRMISNKWAEASLFYDLAEMDRAQGNWNQALANLATATRINQEADDQQLQMQLFEASYKVYDTLGQAGQALAYFKKYVILHDTLMSVEKSKRIEELSIRLELLQKNEENLLLKQDVRASKLRLQLLIGFIFIVFLTGFLIIRLQMFKHRALALKNKLAENDKQLKEVEMQKLSVDLQLRDQQLASLTRQKLVFEEMNRIELEKTQIELQMKEQELVYQTLLRIDLTQVNRSVQEKLLPFQHKFSSKTNQNEFLIALKEITRDSEKEPMADFEFMFSQLHKSFIDNLMVRCNTLTRIELQVCSLLRVNLSTKDIARLLNISVGSVDMCRHRVRQKLGLDQTDNLTAFLVTL